MLDGIKKWIASKGIKSVVPTLTRLAIGVVIGFLIKSGLADQAAQLEQATPAIVEFTTAGALALFTAVWSMIEKAKTVPATPKVVAEAKGVEYAVPTKK